MSVSTGFGNYPPGVTDNDPHFDSDEDERIDDCDEDCVQDAYVAFRETEPCHRCGEGESWTVKGPDGACIGQSWDGEDAECNAEEMAQALNSAFELGRTSKDIS